MNPNVKRNTNVEEVLQESQQQYLPTIMVERWMAMAVERGDNNYEFQDCYGVNQKGGDSSSDKKQRLPLSTAEDDEEDRAPPPPLPVRPGPLFRQRSNSFRLPRPVAEAQQEQASLLRRCGTSLRTLEIDLDTPTVQEMITPLPPIKLIDYSCSKRRASTGRPQDEEEKKNDPGRYHTRDQLKLMNSSAHKSFSSTTSSEEEDELDALAPPPPPPPVRLQRQRSSSLPPMSKSTTSRLMEDDSLHLLDLEEDDSDSEEEEDPLDEDLQQQAGPITQGSKRRLVDYTKRRCSRIPKQQKHRPLFRQKSNSFRFSKKSTMEPSSTTTKLGGNNSTGNLGLGSSFDIDAWMHDNDNDGNTHPDTTIPIKFRVRRSSMTHNNNNNNNSSNNNIMNQSSPQLNHKNDNVHQQQHCGSNSDHRPRLGRQIHRRSRYRQLMQGGGPEGKGKKQDTGRGRSPTNTSSSSSRRASASPPNHQNRREQHSQSSSRPQRRRASMAGSLVPPPQYWVNNKIDIPPSSDQHPSSSSSPPRRATDITATATTASNYPVNKKDSTSTTTGSTITAAIKLPAVPRPRRIQWTKSNSCSHLDLMESSDDEEEKEHNNNNNNNNKKKDNNNNNNNKLRQRSKSRKGSKKKHGSSTALMMDRSWNGTSMDMSRSDKDHSLRRASMASHFITGTRIKRHSMSPARDM